MDLAEIKERSERDWAELVSHYTLNSERAEACANQQMKDVRDLIAKVEELETECKERVAEKMEWLGERGTLQAEVALLQRNANIWKGQATKYQEAEQWQKGLKEKAESSLTLSREEGRREGMEEGARIVEERGREVKGAIDPKITAAAIRSEAKGERG